MSSSNIIGVKDLPVEFEMEMHRPKLKDLDDGIDLNNIITEYEMNLTEYPSSINKDTCV